jgi:hypothetical protein
MTVEKLSRTPTVCHTPRLESQSQCKSYPAAFLCAPYVIGDQSRPRPAGDMSQCPWALDGESCRLNKHAWRDRKTGPCVALRIYFCWTHGRYFTVYPMGHVPYSRKPVLPVDFGGHVPAGLGGKEEAASVWEESWFRSRGRCLDGAAMAA